MNALISPKLMRHQDSNMALLLITLLRKTTKITTPKVPYNDDEVISNIFHLFVTTFCGYDVGPQM